MSLIWKDRDSMLLLKGVFFSFGDVVPVEEMAESDLKALEERKVIGPFEAPKPNRDKVKAVKAAAAAAPKKGKGK